MAICEKGLTKSELETWRDVAVSTKDAYDKLKEALGPVLEKLNEMKDCVDEVEDNFSRGYRSNQSTKKDIDSEIDSIKTAINSLINDFNNYLNECGIRRTFYEALKDNIDHANITVNNKYSTSDIDYKWYEGGSLRESAKINKTIKKKNKVRFNIDGSYVEIDD